MPGIHTISVMSVAKLSLNVLLSQSTREYILERSHMNAASAGKPSARSAGSHYIREFTQGRNPLSVVCVEKSLASSPQLFSIRDVMPNKGQTDQRRSELHKGPSINVLGLHVVYKPSICSSCLLWLLSCPTSAPQHLHNQHTCCAAELVWSAEAKS